MPMMSLERAPLLADESLTGAVWCRAHTAVIDAWLEDLLAGATNRATDGVALVAVGGYGRAELCPYSDIDVYFVHDRRQPTEIAERVWYPIWDEPLHLGHSVYTVRQALEQAAEDLDTATALLTCRHVAGDDALTTALAKGAAELWERKAKRWLADLGAGVAARHEKAGEIAFSLEPDLKEGRGGLRDAHALAWAEAAHRTLLDHDEVSLSASYGVLLDARVELQRHTGRAGNVLTLEDQDAVADALGDADADALMARIAGAARTIAWTSDDTWRRIRSTLRGPLGRVARRNRVIDSEIRLRDGEISLIPDAAPGDPSLLLRAALAAADHKTVIERSSLERLAATPLRLSSPWPAPVRELFVHLLLAGRPAIAVIEALDQRGIWPQLVPEWDAVRALPQRNPYHRYTVDRHLLETVANAARASDDLRRPDLLVVTALLHDIGKGSGSDHVEQGVAVARGAAARMGFSPADQEAIVTMIAHHLLLADVATRRDLDDPATIERVATVIGSSERLELLAALTAADSMATGPAAWGPWKAELVGQLVDRVADLLSGTPADDEGRDHFPSASQLRELADGVDRIEVLGHTLTVMTADRPGVFSRVAGVLALHGLDVLAAAAHSTEDGRALAQFRVHDPVGDHLPWDRVRADLRLALDGGLALEARVAERATRYSRRRPGARPAAATRVSVDTEASATSTVIDVQTADGIGVLYRITRALAELDLDIRSARVQTLGATVVDAFYVRSANGEKITDGRLLDEIERAVLHRLDR
jgi:[protein-PII] uridylyltransferase